MRTRCDGFRQNIADSAPTAADEMVNASRSDHATHSRSCACCLAQKQAPTYGAIPSAADLKKKKEGEEAEKVWREEFVNSLLQPEALERLNQLEQNNSAKVC